MHACRFGFITLHSALYLIIPLPSFVVKKNRLTQTDAK